MPATGWDKPIEEHTVADIIAGFGGYEALKEGMARYGALADDVDARRDELTATYPDRWVAVVEDGRLFVGDSQGEVLEAIKRNGLSGHPRVIAFLDTNPDAWIL